jgi:hypothetical protein
VGPSARRMEDKDKDRMDGYNAASSWTEEWLNGE